MSDAVIRGLIGGLILGLLGVAVDAIWKIIRSQSEGARRIKITFRVAFFLCAAAFVISAFGIAGAIGIAVTIIVIIWIYKGFKSHPSPQPNINNNFDYINEAQPNESSTFSSNSKTVIVCPNCSGKLRVIAGKYLDVTCTHCGTVFRIYT